MIAVPNLGCVGYVVKACTVLQLHRLVVNCLLGCGHFWWLWLGCGITFVF